MIGHAVFDLDGTLVDSAPLCASILNAMLAERGAGPPLSQARTRPYVTAGGRAMVEALLGPACGDVDASLAEFRARYAATPTPPDCLYADVPQGLRALKDAGVGLAIFSNKPQALCDKVMADLGLTDLFDAIVGTSERVPLKPDPAGLDLALALAGATRGRACFVGDSEGDHALARRAGIALVMVAHGYGEVGREWPGALLAADFARVPDLVMKLLTARAAA